MRKKLYAVTLAVTALAASISAAHAQDDIFPTAVISDARGALTSTNELIKLKRKRSTKKAIKDELDNSGMRVSSVRQEGLRIGAQTGLSKRYTAIVKYLEANENRLNVLYNFAPFVDGKLLLPAVAKMQDTFALDESTGEATTIRNSYTISEEARIIANVPTWRDYLVQDFGMPEDPHYSILPSNDIEAAAWEEALDEGWLAGITMADEIFSDHVAQLTKTLEERYRYQLLLNQGVVSAPVLGVDRRSISYNGRTLNVGETIYSVEQPVNYTATPNWRPVWTR